MQLAPEVWLNMNSIWMYYECSQHVMWIESESQSVCFTFVRLNFLLFELQLVFLIRDIPLVSSIERHAVREIILKTEMVNTYIFEGTTAPWLWQCVYHLSYQSRPESR